MPRKRQYKVRAIAPDPIHKSELITKLINHVMLDGKKSTACSIVYEAIDEFSRVLRPDNLIEAIEQAIQNAKPTLEVKSKRVGGATYQVPIEILPKRSLYLAISWLVRYSRAKAGQPMKKALAKELIDCYNRQGSTIKKRDDTHRMADANKAFAHYR